MAYQVDFTFIIPNTRWHREGEGRYWNHIPYPEAVLSTVLRNNGYTINHIDANVEDLSPDELAERVKAKAGKVVGVSAMSVEYKDAVHKVFDIVKKNRPETKTVIGGVYPSLSPEVAMKDSNIDYIVISEGEKRIVDLMEAIKNNAGWEKVDGLHYKINGRLFSNNRTDNGNIGDLDKVPFPDYSDYDTDKLFMWSQPYTQNFQFEALPMTIMMTSRGCVYKCTYCGAGKEGNPINDGIKRRSPENVLMEIDQLVDKYGIREFVFVDDSLLLPSERIIAIMKGIAQRRKDGVDIRWKSNNLDIRHVKLPEGEKGGDDDMIYWMKESGCYQVSVSLESGSLETLKRMKRPTPLKKAEERLKAIRKYGIDQICSNFIIGMPGDTMDDIHQTFDFGARLVKEGTLDYALFSIATPLPGTEMADEAIAKGYVPENFDPTEFYGFGHGMIETPEFNPRELERLRATKWDEINFGNKPLKHHQKIAKMLGITMEQLNNWRQETTEKSGVKVKVADTTDKQYVRPGSLDEMFIQTNLPNLFKPHLGPREDKPNGHPRLKVLTG